MVGWWWGCGREVVAHVILVSAEVLWTLDFRLGLDNLVFKSERVNVTDIVYS